MSTEVLDINTLENWLWDAACKIRGEIDAPKYKDYILPLIFIKRLSDVFNDELDKLIDDFGDEEIAEELLTDDHSLVRFYIPKDARWKEIAKQSIGVGEYLTNAVRSIARENPKLQGVIDIVDFNATTAGQRIISEGKLKALIDVLNKHRLGIKDVEPDIIGRSYEYLLRKFAEGSGQSAGEFYTPKEVAILMAHILDPEPGNKVYDPCCGSGGLLIKCQLRFKEKYPDDTKVKPIRMCGQEIQHSTFAMAKMNIIIHDIEAEIALGDTMERPAFLESDTSLRTFNIVTANPMWNQDFSQDIYENDLYERFIFGYPNSNNADWGWIQHMFKSLKEKGKMAVVLDTGAVSRGSGVTGKNRERDLRKEFINKDLIEAVILLPENLFYNTTAPGIILIINKNKTQKNEILFINSSELFEKGRPKNYIPNIFIEKISLIYHHWKEEENLSKIIKNEDVVKNDFNLSPSRYVILNKEENLLSLEEAVIKLKDAEEKQKNADKELSNILNKLGLSND
ncbi:type I restriction-modification system subunit M [Methanobacterium congolense]|uniref:site-specific DNA-methyltransferase (adenine-specific) n=1 Tax=Methanobacterium congolense TaxID=118062 RepID=A0A1D3L2T5_9EURY|nr:class I SAM-dependent DNA methyltransferase [Methanobacterium congolense]SCG85974.1 putative adenine-specific methylase MJ1220 [Methanobacterium congolense]